MSNDPLAIGQAFLQAYYENFMAGPDQRGTLKALYRPTSTLIWQEKPYQGEQIAEKFDRTAPTSKFEFLNSDPTIQPLSDGILISVCGVMKVDGEVLGAFFHTFNLRFDNTWYIQNEIFKLMLR